MAQLIKKASKGASIYVNGTKKDLTPEQWDAFKAEFGNNPEMISYFTDENNTSSFRMNDNGTITVNGMPLSTDSRKRRAKRTDDANTEKLYNFFNGLSTTIKGKNIMNYAGDYNLGYDASDDGKTHTLNRAAVNANAMKRLDALVNFDPNSWDAIEGFENFSDKTALKNYVDQYVKPNYEYLKAALTSGATKEDFKKYKDIFNSIGIYADKKSSGSEGDSTKPAAGTTAGIIGDNIVHDGNGGFRFKDDTINAFMNSDAMKEYVGKNLWLNDEFVDWASKNHGIDFSWITPGTGLFRINGKWVDGSKVNGLTGHDKLAFDNWVKHNIDNPGGDNSKIVQYWGTENPYKYIGGDNYINGLSDGSYYIDDSWRYERGDNTPHVYRTWDEEIANQEGFRDAFGHINRNMLKTVYVDSDGNIIQDFDPNTLKLLGEKESIDQLQGKYKTPENPYLIDTEKRKYKSVFQNASKESNEKWGLITDGNGRYYWRHNGMKGYTNDMGIHGDPNGLSFEIDPRVAQWLIQQQKAGKLDQKMAVNVDRLIKSLYHRNKIFDRSGLFDLYKSLGIAPSDVFNYTLGEHQYQSGLYDVLNSAEAVKRGHVIAGIPYSEVESKQHGGIVSKVKSETKKHKSTDSSISRNVGESKGLGDNTALTGADKAELAALAADLGSAITAFVPGANVASAGIGAAGSVADFAANISRDGLDWGDVGRFALNLGLDAATLIPFAGGAAKATKIAKLITESKAIGKAVNIIGGLSSGAGAGMGIVAAYNNIVNGDDWTIEDIRTVVNGIRGITNLSRLKGSAVKKGEVTDNSKGTIGSGDDAIQITKKEYDDIMSLPKDQQVSKMAEYIKANAKNKESLTKPISDDEAEKLIKELGDRPTQKGKDQTEFDAKVAEIKGRKVEKSAKEILDEFGVKIKPQKEETTWNPKTWDFWHRGGVKSDIEFKPGDDLYLNPNDLPWWNWNRRAAIRDTKTNRNNPYFNKFARTKKSKVMSLVNDEYGDWNQMVPITGYYRSPIALNTYHNLYPQIFRDEVNAENAFDTYYEPIAYKKGGKVLKGKNGLEDITNKANKSSWNSLKVDNPFISKNPFSDIETQTDIIYNDAQYGVLPEEKVDDVEFNEAFSGLMKDRKYKKMYNQEMRKINPSHTTSLKSNLFQDIGKGLVDTGRLALNLASAKNQEKKMAEAIKSSRVQYEMPNLVAPRYDNSSVEHLQSANRNAFAQQRLSLPKTSDSTRNFAMQQSVASNESKAKAQENMAYSQTQSAFNKMNNEFQNKLASLRADVVTKQRAEDARVASALKANEAKGQAQRDASIDAYLTQLSTDQRNFQHARRQAQANNELMEHTVRYQNDYDALYDRAKQRALAADSSLSGDKLIEKIQSDEQFKQEYQHLNNLFAAKKAYASNYAYNPMLWRYESFPGYIPSTPGGTTYLPDTRTAYKNGGKLSYMQKVDLEEIKNAHKLQQENRKAFLKKMIKEDEQLYKVLLKLVK